MRRGYTLAQIFEPVAGLRRGLSRQFRDLPRDGRVLRELLVHRYSVRRARATAAVAVRAHVAVAHAIPHRSGGMTVLREAGPRVQNHCQREH